MSCVHLCAPIALMRHVAACDWAGRRRDAAPAAACVAQAARERGGVRYRVGGCRAAGSPAVGRRAARRGCMRRGEEGERVSAGACCPYAAHLRVSRACPHACACTHHAALVRRARPGTNTRARALSRGLGGGWDSDTAASAQDIRDRRGRCGGRAGAFPSSAAAERRARIHRLGAASFRPPAPGAAASGENRFAHGECVV